MSNFIHLENMKMKSESKVDLYTIRRKNLNKMLDKNWKLTQDKFSEHLNNMKYYDWLPLRPGPEFFRVFVEHHQHLRNIRINIPHIIGIFDEKFYLYTDEAGYIAYTNIFKENLVLDKIAEIAKHNL